MSDTEKKDCCVDEEQRTLLQARFARGVLECDLLPTFMACERTYKADGKGYYGAALSRRRAEWHGKEEDSTEEKKKSGGGGKTHVNTFVPWRAIFCSASIMRPPPPRERDDDSPPVQFLSFLSDRQGAEVVVGADDVVEEPHFVLEYGPSGALLETRLETRDNGDCMMRIDSEAEEQPAQQQHLEPPLCRSYVLLDTVEEVARWWAANGSFVSQDQFFPPALRMRKQLPDTLIERRTKMAQYGG